MFYVQTFVMEFEDGEQVDEFNGPCFGPYEHELAARMEAEAATLNRGVAHDHIEFVVMELHPGDIEVFEGGSPSDWVMSL
jgi:hypothetical protein